MPPSKICFKCGAEKPLPGYYKHRGMADGHLNKCKECTKKDVHEYRQENIEKVRAYDVDRGKIRHAGFKGREKDRKYAEKYPLRKRCNDALNNAVRDGHVVKPLRCEQCKKETTISGHHHSYAWEDRFNVTWLCQRCHSEEHKRLRREGISL